MPIKPELYSQEVLILISKKLTIKIKNTNILGIKEDVKKIIEGGGCGLERDMKEHGIYKSATREQHMI